MNTTLSTKLSETENYSLLLQHSLNERDERVSEITAETSSLEQDLYASHSLVERLRTQLKEAETQKSLAEKQYEEGNATSEKEREYYEGLEGMMGKLKESHAAAIEKLRREKADSEREMIRLRDRLDESAPVINSTAEAPTQDSDSPASQTKSSNSNSTAEPTTASQNASPEFLTLQSELSHLHKSHSTLSSTLNQLQSELKEVKASNSELRDECETYRDILQEKTFSGALLAESAVLSGWKGGGGREGALRGVFGNNEDEDSEEEEREQETDVGETSKDNQDDVDDVPDTPRVTSEASKRAVRRKANRSSQPLLEIPTDLASEIEGSEERKEELEKKKEEKKRLDRKRGKNGEVSSDILGEFHSCSHVFEGRTHGKITHPVLFFSAHPTTVLQTEVFELRDANKALTLYISKIIDRIVAKEGYESVLAADDDRSGKKAAGVGSMRRKNQSQRPSVIPTSPPLPSSEPQPQSPLLASLKNSRRQSGGLLGLVGRATGQDGSSSTSPSLPGQSQKRRTSSIDWRSLIPGAGSSSPSEAAENPNFKPFSLQGSRPGGPGNRSSMQFTASPSSGARKLAPTEEVEDATDKAERERIRAELILQGITPPENQLKPNLVSRPGHASTPSSSLGFGAFISRVVSGSSPATENPPETNLIASQSMVRSPSFEGPKLTTFEDPSPSRPQVPSQSTRQMTDPDQLRAEQRSRALDSVGSDLTEYSRPVRSSRGNGDRSISSSTVSRSSSIGGDESYGLPPGEVEDEKVEESSTWGKAMKRMSGITGNQ